jgi:hypothetical protein
MIYILAILAFLVAGAVGYVRLWNEVLELRGELRRMRRAQDTLIEMVSSKLLEDDALSREFMKLKLDRDDG